jgi:DNA repair protein RadC
MDRISDLAPLDRPRERLRNLGPSALTSAELLAVILGTGSKKEPVLQLARHLLQRFETMKGLSEATLEELQSVSGIGMAKALKLKAAFSLTKRCEEMSHDVRPLIKTSHDAYRAALPHIKDGTREMCLAILLDIRRRLIKVETISIGTLTRTFVHPREVLFSAIRRKANSLVVVHNHPSGNPSPSEEDFKITQQLNEAANLVSIPLLDHLIICQNKYYSFLEGGFKFQT